MKKLWKYLPVIALIVALDQWTKWIVISNIGLHETVPFWSGVLSWTHYHNEGAAWSMLEGQRWLFVAVFVLLTALLLLEYFKFRMPFTPVERWCIAAIYAGGLGNMIDRVRWGYVVDMIQTDFMDFPIFNVADCFVSCGCVLLLVHLVFFNKQFWKEEKK